MFSTNNCGYLLQQPGLIQNGEQITGLHDAILQQAIRTQKKEDNRPIWSFWKSKRPFSWATRMIQKLNFRDHQAIRKQTQKHYHPASTTPGT